jgi:hypothetical protein
MSQTLNEKEMNMAQNRNYNRKSTRTREAAPPAMIAWHVTERDDKAFWTRIGAAWDHKDGEGLTLQLDLVPTGTGRIVLRVPGQADEASAEA